MPFWGQIELPLSLANYTLDNHGFCDDDYGQPSSSSAPGNGGISIPYVGYGCAPRG